MSLSELESYKIEYLRALSKLTEAETEFEFAEEQVNAAKFRLDYLWEKIKELEPDFNELS